MAFRENFPTSGIEPAELNACFREAFANLAAQPVFIIRLVASSGDETLHGIQQFQPVFQGRLFDTLPLVITLLAVKKVPFAPDVLRVHLQFFAIVGATFPTDFGLGHF